MNYKLAVVGAPGTVELYRVLGCEVYPVYEPKEADKYVRELAAALADEKDKIPAYAVIFVEERFFEEIGEDIKERLAYRPLPALIPISASLGEKASSKKESFALKRLRKMVERAVGSDILGS